MRKRELKLENMRTPIIVGNWKLNKTIHEAVALITSLQCMVDGVSDVEIVVAPVFTALATSAEALAGGNIRLAAQDVFWEDNGAFTGEVSPRMLKDVGCNYVIIGHSERRQYFGETNENVNRKVKASHAHGLIPIICTGESLEQREAGRTEAVVRDHLFNGIAGLSAAQIISTVIAYEPVWAIGTGRNATPDQAQEVHALIRSLISDIYSDDVALKVRIQYGGSVKPANAGALLAQPDVDGALVGTASWDTESFAQIIKAADNAFRIN